MKYKAIFFDADGVLIKSKYLFTEQLERDYGIKIEKMLPFFAGVFRECGAGRADLKQELAKVINDWGWKGTVEELLEYWFTKGTEIDDEIIEYIESLKSQGVRVFMSTDQEKYRGRHLQKILGKGKVFEEVFFSAQAGYPKKKAEFWDYVFERIESISRNDVLFVDDDEENVESVMRFGIESFLYRDLEGLNSKLSE